MDLKEEESFLRLEADCIMQDQIEGLQMSPSSTAAWAEALAAFPPEERAAMMAQATQFKHNRDQFDALLQEKGMTTIVVAGDGNCLFRSISYEVYSTDEHFALIRYYICIFIRKFPSQCFRSHQLAGKNVSQVVDDYLVSMAQDKEWGDDVAIRAASRLYERPVKVWISDGVGGIMVHPDFPGINTEESSGTVGNKPPNSPVRHEAKSRFEDQPEADSEMRFANFNGVSHFNPLDWAGASVWRLTSPVGLFEERRLA